MHAYFSCRLDNSIETTCENSPINTLSKLKFSTFSYICSFTVKGRIYRCKLPEQIMCYRVLSQIGPKFTSLGQETRNFEYSERHLACVRGKTSECR